MRSNVTQTRPAVPRLESVDSATEFRITQAERAIRRSQQDAAFIHEISPPHLVQFEAEEAADVADAAVDRGGVRPVRFLSAIQQALVGGVAHGGRGPVDRPPQGVHHPAAAGKLRGADGPDPRRGFRDAPDLVRRHLPGPEKFLHAKPRRAGEISQDASRNHPATGTDESLAGNADGRDCRPADGEPLPLENR